MKRLIKIALLFIFLCGLTVRYDPDKWFTTMDIRWSGSTFTESINVIEHYLETN